MKRLTSSITAAVCVAAGSLAVGGWGNGIAFAATQLNVDSTAAAGGDCTQVGQCTLGAAMTRAQSLADVSIVLPAGTFTVSTPLAVPTTGVTISGAGAATVIEGIGAERLLEASGGSLRLSELRLSGGFAAETGGGAVFATNTVLTLDHVVVSGNGATGDGGAIGLVGGSLTIVGSSFSDNYGQNGGALFTANTSVAMTEATFTSNGASQSGGAAFVSFPPTFDVVDSTFSDNQSVGDGGAIAVEGVGDAGTAGTIVDSTFDGNNAAGLGGAVFVRTSPNASSAGLLVDGSDFTGNGADAGGALALSDPPAVVSGSTFTSNTAEGSGGAIVSNTTLTVHDATFDQNSSGDSGGAIASSGELAVARTGFTANHAGGSGGAFLLIGALPTINGSFAANTADGEGAVAFWTGRSVLSIAGVSAADIYASLSAIPTPTPSTPTTAPTTPTTASTTPTTPTTASGTPTTLEPTNTTASPTPVDPGSASDPGDDGQSGAVTPTMPVLTGRLPTTGSDVAAVLQYAALALLLGGALLTIRLRRVRR